MTLDCGSCIYSTFERNFDGTTTNGCTIKSDFHGTCSGINCKEYKENNDHGGENQ